jgi:hypothetical protein
MKTSLRTGIIGLAFFCICSLTGRAQLTYVTNNGTITITGYTGPAGAVTIPETINGLPVTTIGNSAFSNCATLTSIVIPACVTDIGPSAFSYSGLMSVDIPDNVSSLGPAAFYGCDRLANVKIGNSVKRLEPIIIPALFPGPVFYGAFGGCLSLTNVTLGNSLELIGAYTFESCWRLENIIIPASVLRWETVWVTIDGLNYEVSGFFYGCPHLAGIYFEGHPPAGVLPEMFGNGNPTIYYLPGTTGWENSYGGRPTAPWFRPNPVILSGSSAISTNGFAFIISWATNASVIVEAASTDIANPIWVPLSTNNLVDGWSYFSDAEWTNYPSRFYRIRHP